MRIYLTAAILLGLLAGCSSDQGSSDNKATASASSTLQKWGALPTMAGSPMASFASLPDRGELLSYEQGLKAKHSGAYTAYPVSLSEAHALNAMRTGEMVVNAPNGELIRLTYESHVEHPDGNWSWIGRNADGASAVLTFGEKAVFGTIPQGASDALRLTMSAGRSWLVQTDRSKLAGLDGATRREGTDQMIPPKLAAASGGMSTASMSAQPAVASAAASAAVVDVLLGYTTGFAAQLGGQSQANTRLNNMIVITNQAYVNSGVNMRVRLVKTLQVNYADNNNNGDTLEKLTGYKSGTGGGPITPDPAFNALRAARNEVGADLVSLVHPFRTPENDGCGIAWLIGGDQSGILQTDERFGYSVVSDGTDLDEGDQNTYFCREETLAHEMGHNMGQAHNEEDSDTPGVHAYSYGYRESPTNGFYTVMAYPQTDGNQFAIPYFANPSVKYSGRATGVANQSDNVRSLNQSMSIVSTFRDTVVPNAKSSRNDFNGDSFADILWRNASTGQNVIWQSAITSSRRTLTSVDSAWSVAATVDVDGDSKSDIVWRKASTGTNVVWLSGNSATRKSMLAMNSTWALVGAGDLNGDGKADLVWRRTDGANIVWNAYDGSKRSSLTSVDPSWIVAAVADFNGDGKADILWRRSSSGVNVIWYAGNSSTRSNLANVNSAWVLAGTGDFNGDGKADVLWRNPTAGTNVVWWAGNSTSRRTLTGVDSSWQIAEVADFSGDGKDDILWRRNTGVNTIWMAADSNSRKAVSTLAHPTWKVESK